MNSSPIIDGSNFQQGFDQVAALAKASGFGNLRVNFRLRDWGVSRQRYWGCPIPMVYCGQCGAVPVPEDQLPVVLPEDVAFSGTNSPIKSNPEWRKTTCPQCGTAAERETDTFDTFMESSWYYARYTSPGANDLVDERANYWLPVDQYIGGIEHAIMHLMYFRFYHKLMRDAGLVKTDEPATNLLCQGMVIADTFYRDLELGARDWINPVDVDVSLDDKGRVTGAVLKADGQPVFIGGTEKMSKSKNNGVDPQIMVDKFGADTVRLFSMFAAPPVQSLDWNESGVEGCFRFLKRFWRYSEKVKELHLTTKIATTWEKSEADLETISIRREIHELLSQATYDFERQQFNTVVSAAMKMLNALDRLGDGDEFSEQVSSKPMTIDVAKENFQRAFVRREALEILTLLLNPITPHTSHAVWQAMGRPETTLEDIAFPTFDESALVRDSVKLAVQVNGKLRATIEVAVNMPKQEIERLAQVEPNVQKHVEGLAVKKIIIVPGKIVNIVVG